MAEACSAEMGRVLNKIDVTSFSAIVTVRPIQERESRPSHLWAATLVVPMSAWAVERQKRGEEAAGGHMGTAVSGICKLAPGVPEADSSAIEERRSAFGADLLMAESVGEPGEVRVLPLPHLILSQAICHSFHYHCDLGAGCFSGHSIPMDFVVVVPDAHTWCRIDNPHRLRFLAIPMSLARRFLGRSDDDPLDFGVLHTRHNSDPFIGHALDALWHELALGDQATGVFLEAATAGILARLERLSEQSPYRQAAVGGLTAWQSARVLDYMREHLADPISLCELADLIDLSPWHFSRAFRQSHGLPPHRYLTRLRLEKARGLLARSQLSITEIAMVTGYSSQHLARHFRHYLGCTPREYRRKNGH